MKDDLLVNTHFHLLVEDNIYMETICNMDNNGSSKQCSN